MNRLIGLSEKDKLHLKLLPYIFMTSFLPLLVILFWHAGQKSVELIITCPLYV